MKGREKLLRVGEYEVVEGTPVISREFYGEGYIVKDEDAYLNHPDQVCYVPELSDTTYSHNDLLKLCNQQECVARFLFDILCWDHPESRLQDLYGNEELGYCETCKKIYFLKGEEKPCPKCGHTLTDF